jgi:hypothetical protein
MRFEKFSFGSIRIHGTTYEHDVVIDRGPQAQKEAIQKIPRRLWPHAVFAPRRFARQPPNRRPQLRILQVREWLRFFTSPTGTKTGRFRMSACGPATAWV